jgi:hypothetical protein
MIRNCRPSDASIPKGAAMFGAIERREQLCLALEARLAVGIREHRLRENLDRHIATEPGIAGAIDLAHAPDPDEFENFV